MVKNPSGNCLGITSSSSIFSPKEEMTESIYPR